VAFLTDFLSNFGGTEHHNVRAALALRERGVDVRVFCAKRPVNPTWTSILRRHGVTVLGPFSRRLPVTLRHALLCTVMRRYFSWWRPDVIVANPLGPFAVAWLQRRGRLAAVPVAGVECLEPSPRSAHFYPIGLSECIDDFQTIIVTCEASRRGVECFHGYRGQTLTVAPLVPQPEVVSAPTVPATHIGCISRLSVEKGLDYLVAAMAIIVREAPDARLSIYGEGRDRRRLHNLIGCFGLREHVRLEGEFSPDGGASSVLSRHLIYVQPSLLESIPTTLLELMARGRVVVASAVGGVSEVLDHRLGVLVPPGDARRLATALLGLLADPESAARKGAAARAFHLENFSFVGAVDALVQVLHDTVGELDPATARRSADQGSGPGGPARCAGPPTRNGRPRTPGDAS
jgi:glycosyltransferase involved in cell wall biosynthesis